MIDAATTVTQTGISQWGVKGASILCCIPLFDIVQGFVPNYVHSMLLGVVRQFVEYWLHSSRSNRPYYIGSRIEEIDLKLLSIKPPIEIRRLPRSLSTRKYWKASEYRSFLLFYSFIMLQGVLPNRYLKHWLLLVNAATILIDSQITRNDLEYANTCLLKCC